MYSDSKRVHLCFPKRALQLNILNHQNQPHSVLEVVFDTVDIYQRQYLQYILHNVGKICLESMSSFLAAEIKKEMDFGLICLISISFSINISLTKLSESSESPIWRN